jgi:D-3-phosphoglycerate dehydrogenase
LDSIELDSGFEGVELLPFEEVLKQSDIISIHCPAEGNIDLINAEEINKMKDGVEIINVSRGGIINEEALDEALSSKKVAAYGLDVATIEPMPATHPLLKHRNVTASPHMAWYSEESAQELKRKVAEESARFARGEAVHYSVLK